MKIEFKNSYKSTRSGFKHETQVFVNDEFVHQSTAHYLNRTWESYAYQSVMKQALHEMIELEKARLKAEYKEHTGKKRVSKSMEFDNDYILALTLKRGEL